MNSFIKGFCDGKSYAKTTRKLEFEMNNSLLVEFVRYMTDKKLKPKFSGLSFEVQIIPFYKLQQNLR